jgi:hypothetical protein
MYPLTSSADGGFGSTEAGTSDTVSSPIEPYTTGCCRLLVVFKTSSRIRPKASRMSSPGVPRLSKIAV